MLPALLHPFAKPTETEFTNLVKAEGVHLWDDTGKRYIDGIGSLWYCQVGHGRREIIDAIAEQMAELSSFNIFYPWTSPVADAAAERIRSLSPFSDGRVFLCNSGSEAIDTALKISRKVAVRNGQPERQIILRRSRAYHGTNIGGTTMQGIPSNRDGWGDLLPHVIEVGSTDIESAAAAFAEHGQRIAAIVAEPVQCAGGVVPPPPGYLEGLRRLCDDNGALLVFDEVVTGFGRTGNWFASETFGVTPDLFTFAKGVTSGYQPLGGVALSRNVAAVLEAEPAEMFAHGYTYSGHPAACAAALANIDIIEREGLVERASGVGQRLAEGLRALEADGHFAEVRGSGAVWAGELVGEDALARSVRVRDRMLELGVAARAAHGAICFCPPLIIEDHEVDEMIDACQRALHVQ